MHELSLANSLLEQLRELARDNKAVRITRVRVTLGPFSGVVRDSFEFGFNVLKDKAELTRDAELVLETPDPIYACGACGKVAAIPFAVPGDRMEAGFAERIPKKCPWCCQPRLSPKGGSELILNQVEME